MADHVAGLETIRGLADEVWEDGRKWGVAQALSHALVVNDHRPALLAEVERVGRERGRKAGRAEAAAILLAQEAESFPETDGENALVESYPIGDTGDYGTSWITEKVLDLFDARDSEMTSILDRLEGGYWEAVGRKDDADWARDRALKERDEARETTRATAQALSIASDGARAEAERADKAECERGMAEEAYLKALDQAQTYEHERDEARAELADLRAGLATLARKLDTPTRMFLRFGETGERAAETNGRDRGRAEAAKEITALLRAAPAPAVPSTSLPTCAPPARTLDLTAPPQPTGPDPILDLGDEGDLEVHGG